MASQRRGHSVAVGWGASPYPCAEEFRSDRLGPEIQTKARCARTADRPPLSIVELVVIAPRRHRGRTLQELRRLIARFARSRALGGIAADFGL
jgi:hypothetical protein